jgi:hypothetical protein
MKSAWKPGLLLGILVGLWTLIMGLTGWYKNPALMNIFYVVILIEIGVLIWALKKTSLENTYWKQVGHGTLIAILGSVIIFFVSILFTTVLYPNYFSELQVIQEQMLRQQGRSEAEIRMAMDTARATGTPLVNALMGVVGTIATGFVASLVIGVFYRKKQ